MQVLAPVQSFGFSQQRSTSGTSFHVLGGVGRGVIWNKAVIEIHFEAGLQIAEYAFSFSNSNDATIENFLAGRGIPLISDNTIGSSLGNKRSWQIASTVESDNTMIVSLARPVFIGPEFLILAFQLNLDIDVGINISVEVLGMIDLNRKKELVEAE